MIRKLFNWLFKAEAATVEPNTTTKAATTEHKKETPTCANCGHRLQDHSLPPDDYYFSFPHKCNAIFQLEEGIEWECVCDFWYRKG